MLLRQDLTLYLPLVWPRISCVDQSGMELRDPAASASQCWNKACATTLDRNSFLCVSICFLLGLFWFGCLFFDRVYYHVTLDVLELTM